MLQLTGVEQIATAVIRYGLLTKQYGGGRFAVQCVNSGRRQRCICFKINESGLWFGVDVKIRHVVCLFVLGLLEVVLPSRLDDGILKSANSC